MVFGAVLASSPLPPFIAGLIIGVPSVILYLLEAFILLKYWKQLHSPFFRLFLVRFTLVSQKSKKPAAFAADRPKLGTIDILRTCNFLRSAICSLDNGLFCSAR
ncbi:hypothetical protein Ddc_21315 [Ditylenchus destructor]|nr:hypothetical protein Ddc_21315 [Ditylenchus destructor]